MPSAAESARRYWKLACAVRRARRAPYDPFKLTWILTERCSLRCRTCHLWTGSPDEGPDIETIGSVLDANRHLTWLNLSGGDLLERPDAPAIMERVATGLPHLALLDFPTAGLDERASLAAIEPLLDSDIPRIYVTVSIDGPDGMHDRVRNLPGAAKRARRTYERLGAIRRPGFKAVVGMTLSRHNLPEHLPDGPDGSPNGHVADMLPSHVPSRDLHLNIAHHSAHYYKNAEDVGPPAATALALVDEVTRARAGRMGPLDMMERRYWKAARRFLLEGDPGGSCGALRASVYVGPDLGVYPCSIFDRRLGDLADIGYSLRRIPEFPGAAEALGMVQSRACPRCWSPCEAFPSLLLNLGRAS
jgi:MoaA/NifB/PqqE/SkfB family radical SAM enzyme